MKTYNHLYSSNKDFESFLDSININRDSAMLIRIHSNVHTISEMQEIVSYIASVLPNAQIVGCSASDVISNGRRITSACLISVSLFDRAVLRGASFECLDDNGCFSGKKLAESLCADLSLSGKHGQLVLFMPAGYILCNDFARRFYELAPNIKIIGGKAFTYTINSQKSNDDRNPAYTIYKGECSTTAASAALILSEDMHCFESHAVGFEKITDLMTIDSSEGNIISSIHGKSVNQWLLALYQNKLDRPDTNILNIFPFIREKIDNTAWAYEVIDTGENGDGILKIDDVLCENERVSIGYISTNAVVDDVYKLYNQLSKQPAETIFVYSCSLRAHLLRNCSAWELSPLLNTNASGAFLDGEFLFDGTHSHFGNYNFVLSLISESDVYPELDTNYLLDTHSLYHDNQNLVNFLLTCASESINNPDSFYHNFQDTLYFDKKLALGNLTKVYYDTQTIGLNKLCMLSVRNGNELLAYSGYKAYDTMLIDVLKKIQKFFAGLPMYYYYSEHGDYLIGSNDEMTSADFEAKMQELNNYLSTIEFNHMLPLFEFCVVLEQTNLLRCAKVVQSVMRSRKISRYMVYSMDMGMDESCIQDVKMVQIINEAIAKNRVLPYYQGIYNNRLKNIDMYESLMRITDAAGNIYYPNSFLGIARKYGLYSSLSRQMIRKVMDNFSERNVYVTINLCMQDILDPRTTEIIYEKMGRTRYPDKFIFEVVESEDVSDYEVLQEFAERIHEFGGKIALDDFGSGFSNLIHVISMDFDFLKVDGSIVRKICDDDNCRKMLKMVSVWCRMQGTKVIAEFVENKEIHDLLCNYGIDFSQGYYFAKPQKLFNS